MKCVFCHEVIDKDDRHKLQSREGWIFHLTCKLVAENPETSLKQQETLLNNLRAWTELHPGWKFLHTNSPWYKPDDS
jgi:hypothetical protein